MLYTKASTIWIPLISEDFCCGQDPPRSECDTMHPATLKLQTPLPLTIMSPALSNQISSSSGGAGGSLIGTGCDHITWAADNHLLSHTKAPDFEPCCYFQVVPRNECDVMHPHNISSCRKLHHIRIESWWAYFSTPYSSLGPRESWTALLSLNIILWSFQFTPKLKWLHATHMHDSFLAWAFAAWGF